MKMKNSIFRVLNRFALSALSSAFLLTQPAQAKISFDVVGLEIFGTDADDQIREIVDRVLAHLDRITGEGGDVERHIEALALVVSDAAVEMNSLVGNIDGAAFNRIEQLASKALILEKKFYNDTSDLIDEAQCAAFATLNETKESILSAAQELGELNPRLEFLGKPMVELKMQDIGNLNIENVYSSAKAGLRDRIRGMPIETEEEKGFSKLLIRIGLREEPEYIRTDAVTENTPANEIYLSYVRLIKLAENTRCYHSKNSDFVEVLDLDINELKVHQKYWSNVGVRP